MVMVMVIDYYLSSEGCIRTVTLVSVGRAYYLCKYEYVLVL